MKGHALEPWLARMGYDLARIERKDPIATGMVGCCPGTAPSGGMLRRDRPVDPRQDLLVIF